MDREQFRKTITTEFYDSLAARGVEVTAIPQAQLQAVVNSLADSVFAGIRELLEEDLSDLPPRAAVAGDASTLATATSDAAAEEVLWTGRPYMTIGTRYELTTERLRIVRGVLGKRLEEVELVRVRDTKVTQNPGERAINVGDITIFSNDPSAPEVVLHNVSAPLDVRELIRKAMLEEKARRGLHYREEM